MFLYKFLTLYSRVTTHYFFVKILTIVKEFISNFPFIIEDLTSSPGIIFYLTLKRNSKQLNSMAIIISVQAFTIPVTIQKLNITLLANHIVFLHPLPCDSTQMHTWGMFMAFAFTKCSNCLTKGATQPLAPKAMPKLT